VRDDLLGHTVSKASLVDDNGICYTLLGIRRIQGGDPFPWFMEFEPILAESKLLTLTVEQLQSVEGDAVPLVKINTILDPWDPMDLDEMLLEKLEQWKEELQAPENDLPPTWECMGQWRYTFSPDLAARQRFCREKTSLIQIPLINQKMTVSRVLSGLTGTLFYCDSYHQSLDLQTDGWKEAFLSMMTRARTPMEFAEKLKASGLQILRPMFFKFSLLSKTTGYSYPCSGTGPWGIFNTRFYYFSDSVEESQNLRLKIEEVFNLSLESPWVFELNLKDEAVNQEVPFTLSSPFINIQGKFTVKEMHYSMDYLLISHEMEIFTGNVKYVRMRDLKIVDQEGCEYQPLDRSTHWSEQHGQFIKALSFPPVHFRGSQARLEINSIDVAPIIPFEFDLTFES